jgi:hypothetical protein
MSEVSAVEVADLQQRVRLLEVESLNWRSQSPACMRTWRRSQ